MKKTVAASTFKNYMTCSRRVLEAFAEFAPQQIRPTHIAQFLDDNKDTPSIASLLRAFLRGAFVRAVRWGIVEADPPATSARSRPASAPGTSPTPSSSRSASTPAPRCSA